MVLEAHCANYRKTPRLEKPEIRNPTVTKNGDIIHRGTLRTPGEGFFLENIHKKNNQKTKIKKTIRKKSERKRQKPCQGNRGMFIQESIP